MFPPPPQSMGTTPPQAQPPGMGMTPMGAQSSAPEAPSPYPAAPVANQMSQFGRGNDSMLMHVTPSEVGGLQQLAQMKGGSLTTNPMTGLPEAGFLEDILPTILGLGLNFIPGVGPLMSAALVGGGTALATGNLEKGLMAGLGAFGGASLGGAMGLGGASAAAAPAATATDGLTSALNATGGAGASAVTSPTSTLLANATGAPGTLSTALQGASSAGNFAGMGANAATTAAPATSQFANAAQAASGVPKSFAFTGAGAPAPVAASGVPSFSFTGAGAPPPPPVAAAAPTSGAEKFLTETIGQGPGERVYDFGRDFAQEASGAGNPISKYRTAAAVAGLAQPLSSIMSPRYGGPREEEENKYPYEGPYLPAPRTARFKPADYDPRDSSEFSFFDKVNPYPATVSSRGYARGGEITDREGDAAFDDTGTGRFTDFPPPPPAYSDVPPPPLPPPSPLPGYFDMPGYSDVPDYSDVPPPPPPPPPPTYSDLPPMPDYSDPFPPLTVQDDVGFSLDGVGLTSATNGRVAQRRRELDDFGPQPQPLPVVRPTLPDLSYSPPDYSDVPPPPPVVQPPATMLPPPVAQPPVTMLPPPVVGPPPPTANTPYNRPVINSGGQGGFSGSFRDMLPPPPPRPTMEVVDGPVWTVERALPPQAAPRSRSVTMADLPTLATAPKVTRPLGYGPPPPPTARPPVQPPATTLPPPAQPPAQPPVTNLPPPPPTQPVSLPGGGDIRVQNPSAPDGSAREELRDREFFKAGGVVGLKRGAFVVDARTVSELGNGSSSAGQDVLSRYGGRPIKGEGDGVSDSIRASIDGRKPARVARDEVLLDPAAVRRFGGGDTAAGAKRLYALMERAQKARATATRGQDTQLRKTVSKK